MPQNARDIEWDDDGDLVIDDSGDLKLATPERTVIQDIEFRLKTQHWDYAPDPQIGANLKKFVGRTNTRATGEAIKEAAYYSLIKDGRFRKDQISVDVLPLSKSILAIIVFLNDYIEGTEDRRRRVSFQLTFVFNLEDGTITRITGVSQ